MRELKSACVFRPQTDFSSLCVAGAHLLQTELPVGLVFVKQVLSLILHLPRWQHCPPYNVRKRINAKGMIIAEFSGLAGSHFFVSYRKIPMVK